MARDIERIPLFPGIPEALVGLAAGGATLAIVTSNARNNVLRVLGPVIAPRISALECGVSLFGKANKLRRVLKRTGIPASQTLFVGDEIRDAEAARAAGVAFGAVGWGYTRLEALRAQAPVHVFERVEDLLSPSV
jgi:phosphoglycolate phosphatase